MLNWLSANLILLGALGTAITFVWSVLQFVLVRKREQETREFDNFHRIVKELVSPDPETKSTWLDRQVAAIFELRHFPRYYEVSQRILSELRKDWENEKTGWQRLITEIDLTLEYISTRSKQERKKLLVK